MIAYLGLTLYTFSTIVRPADWRWLFLYGQPLDWVIWIPTILGRALSSVPPRLSRIWSMPVTKFILFYIAASLLSLVVQGDMDGLSFEFTRLAKLFVIYLGFAVAADTTDRIKWILVLVVLLNVFLAYEGRVQDDMGENIAGQGLYWMGRIRWVGQYDDSNSLCMLFGIALAFAVQFVMGPWHRFLKVFGFISCVWIIKGINLTQSRGGFIAVMAVGIMAVFCTGRRFRGAFSWKKLVIATLLGVVLWHFKPERMEKINDSARSTEGRIEAWEVGIHLINTNPFTGVGAGRWMNYHIRKAHNTVVQVAAEIGLPGLYLFLGIFFTAMGPLFPMVNRLRKAEERSLAGALLGGMVGLLVASYFMSTNNSDLNFIIAGLSASFCELKGLQPVFKMRHMVAVGLTEIALLAVIYVNIIAFYAME
jgi:O-antigen ligase